MKTLDIGVVGTGTAGSASALFLARQGHRVTVYERVPEPSTAGAGIMLQPTGMAVLRALGLEQQVVPRGDVIDTLLVQTASGRKVMELVYGDLQPGLFGVGLHRGVLFDALYRAACREPGVTVRTGCDVEDLRAHADGSHSVIERGTRKVLGRHDVIVAANGARSSLRDDTAFVKSVSRYPWGALWAIVPDEEHRFTGRLFQTVRGTDTLIGLLPTGHGPDGGPRMVSIFFSIPVHQQAAFREGDFSAWKARVLADVPSAAPVLAQLRGPESLLFSEYHDVVMWPWNTERVVYLGDAAHAMSPQLGQGANLALLDAYFLSKAFENAENATDALYAYSRTRRWHLRWYQVITRALTPFFQSDFPWLQPVRDYGFPLATKSAWVRKQMVAAMAGVSRGPFAELLDVTQVHAPAPQ